MMLIPVVVVLWDRRDFRGRRRTLVADSRDLDEMDFAGATVSVGVHRGPSFGFWGFQPTVTLFENRNWDERGRSLILAPGGYAELSSVGFANMVSSVRFDLTLQRRPGRFGADATKSWEIEATPTAAIQPIPLVVTLYTAAMRLVAVESERDFGASFGENCKGHVTAVHVEPGPDYTGRERVRLHRLANFVGGHLEFDVGYIPEYAFAALQMQVGSMEVTREDC